MQKRNLAHLDREGRSNCFSMRSTAAFKNYGVYVAKKKQVSGVTKLERNQTNLILTRDMPPPSEMVSNADVVMRPRNRSTIGSGRKSFPWVPIILSTESHGDSRGPLSKVFICNCCNHKMHQRGREPRRLSVLPQQGRGVFGIRPPHFVKTFTATCPEAIGDGSPVDDRGTWALVHYTKSKYADDACREAQAAKLRAELREVMAKRDRLLLFG